MQRHGVYMRASVCLCVCVAVGVRRVVCIVEFALYEKNVHQPWPLALKSSLGIGASFGV